MKILIIEDEAMVARRIIRMTKNYFGDKEHSITQLDSLSDAKDYVRQNEIDLLLLDLNLNGENGFEILQDMVSKSFHTIIISAYKDKAIEAFEYGVLDFVPKPFNEMRLANAFLRITSETNLNPHKLKFLAVHKANRQLLVEIQQIKFIKGARIYTELHLLNGKVEIHNKSLDALDQLLPTHFERIHKSYIGNMNYMKELKVASGGKYSLLLNDEEEVPVSRTKYKLLKEKWFK